VILYERTDCPFCWKVRLALETLEIPCELVASEAGNPYPQVRELSPTGSVPVLVDGDTVLWDSAVIVEYLDQLAGGRLLRGDARAQANSRQWALYSDRHVGPALRDIVFERRSRSEGERDEELIERSFKSWRACQERLEQNWKPVLPLTLEGCALAARFGVAQAYDAEIDEVHGDLRHWFDKVRETDAWSRAYPKNFIRPTS